MVIWEDGQLVQGAYVEIDGTRYPVEMPQYSGDTPVTAENLNKVQTVQTATVTTSTTIAENTDYTIPLNYRVGDNSLEVIYMGEKLIKGTHYIEVGNTGEVSNTIQFYNWGQSVPTGRTIEFIVRGVYS